jgi:hypothetical protein
MSDPDWDSNDLFRQLGEERALVDDLAETIEDVIADLSGALARYRQARGL